MAARKSCTHLTWSEAKTSSGLSTGSSSKKNTKKLTHQQILAQRIRQGGKFVEPSKPWTKQQIDRHLSAQERAKREEEMAAILEQKESERLEEEKASRIAKPSERARAALTRLAHKLQLEEPPTTERWNEELDELQRIFQNRMMQLDEIDALEAIFTDTDEFLVSDASHIDELRHLVEQATEDDTDLARLKALANHPLLACTLQLTIPDHRAATSRTAQEEDMDLLASILMHVTLPLCYPAHGAPPRFEFKYVMVTDVNEQCGIDKALVSLTHLDEIGLSEQLLQQSMDILPDPCIYEVANTYLTEHVFTFMELQAHALLTRK